ncbi:MAG: 5-oxoprolinase [Akkermansiaceae bacterium]|nr:5-oxoprolinase [Akkermansiaceae bacterium]
MRIDTGGTFTDGWALDPDGREKRCKILSSGVVRTTVSALPGDGWLEVAADLGAAENVLDGFLAPDGRAVTGWMPGARRVRLEGDYAVGDMLELGTGEEAPVVAARLLTATRLGERFPPMEFRVATTRGTNALLEGTGAAGVLFVTEGFEDLLRIRDQRRPDLFALRQDRPDPVFARVVGVRERIAPDGAVLRELDEAKLAADLAGLALAGGEVAAVALLNSYANPAHERRVAEMLERAGVRHVSPSQDLTPAMRLLPRAETAVANAYLAPIMDGFVRGVEDPLGGGPVSLMTSAGALKPSGNYRPVDSLLSGPAGGVVGAQAAGRAAGWRGVLSFDMGGTSTDVARIGDRPRLRYEQQIGPVRVLVPAVRMETVAAGGGSICQWRHGGLEVGPESAGADPGPACYGRGGPLTVTDVNLLLGCMDPSRAGIPLDPGASRAALAGLKESLRAAGAEAADDERLLEGLRAIAVERMADAIRKVSLREGYDPSDYGLVAFGGAGPQHACAVAEKLAVRDILVPSDAGLLSAWGLDRSGREEIVERLVLAPLEELSGRLDGLLAEMEAEALAALGAAGVVARSLFEMRLAGQDSTLELEFAARVEGAMLADGFRAEYEKLYGYAPPAGRAVEVVAVRVVGAERAEPVEAESFGAWSPPAAARVLRQDVFRTCVIEPGWSVAEGERGSLWLRREGAARESAGWSEAVEAELFRCRFENVVEEMGELLRRTAISTNVKERLDFSCALLDARGRLVVNAPHIPVHLGALGECVRKVSDGREWKPGDTVVVNHPAFGGSHLPDITVISPVFFGDGRLVAFVANRAHHAELGGRTPGSMPATASSLGEEGVVIPPLLLVDGGTDHVAEIEALLRGGPFPSRAVDDNLADLAAQTAANRHGVKAVRDLCRPAGCEAVTRNMEALFARAASAMAATLATRPDGRWTGDDAMDDGTPVRVTVTAGRHGLTVDFAGSGAVHPGNLNATPAIVRSAVLYVMRVWTEDDLPLNEGLLEGVEIRLPAGILNPEFAADPAACPAVVGGNVETSQRVVDVLLDALGLQANSQGTMNNFLFGTERFGFYETLGGGSGAGPGWDGMSGTHVHMSNTAVTDPEILEWRYPVRVREFSLRRGSGGAGKWRGGDGLRREIEFLEPMTVSFLTQRRVRGPHGAEGGADGAPGAQVLIRADGRAEPLAPITSFEVRPGERIRIDTPGGGGWGA